MRRSTVLSFPLQLVFPGLSLSMPTDLTSVGMDKLKYGTVAAAGGFAKKRRQCKHSLRNVVRCSVNKQP